MDATPAPQHELETLQQELGTTSASEIIDMVRSMQAQLDELYHDKELSGDSGPEQYERVTKQLYAFHVDRKKLKDKYGVASGDELMELIDSMDAQLTEFYEGTAGREAVEKSARKATRSVERLHEELGTSDADEVLEMIHSMEAQLKDLYSDRETTQGLVYTEVDGDPFAQLQSVYARLDTVQREMNIGKIEDAVDLVRSMESQLAELYSEKEAIAGASGDGALGSAPEVERFRRELGVVGLDEAVELVQSMEHQLSELYKEKETLDEYGLMDAGEAIEMIGSMRDQLDELYRDREATSRALDMAETGDPVQQLQQLYAKLDVLRQELGIAEPDEAVELVRSMEDQLAELYEERRMLTEAGMESAEDMLTMMKSMEEQLKALYSDVESMAQAGFSDPSAALEAIGSLEQQVVELYKEKETALKARGRLVDSGTVPEDAVEGLDLIAAEVERAHAFSGALAEMRGSLQGVLKELEAARELEGHLRSYEEHLANVEAEADDHAQDKLRTGRSLVATIQNLQNQLEELYSEKRRMSDAGVTDADEAVYLIGNLKRQLGELYAEKQRLVTAGLSDPDELLDLVKSMEQQLAELYQEKAESENATEVLQRELGVDDPERVVELVQTLQRQLETYQARAPEMASGESEAALFADEDTLAVLDALGEEEHSGASESTLVSLGYAAVRLDEKGNVTAFHEPDEELGGIDREEALGTSFFSSVAPAANSRLFYGRYKRGVYEGEMDTAFPYTFLHGDRSVNLMVQLHRAAGATHSWILLRNA